MDTSFPVFLKPPESYSFEALYTSGHFGYSIAAHFDGDSKPRLFIGAPKANSAFSERIKSTGAAFSCSLDLKEGDERFQCTEIKLEMRELLTN